MKKLIFLFLLLLSCLAQSVDKTFAWDAPTETDLAYYTLYEQVYNTNTFVSIVDIIIPPGQTIVNYIYQNFSSTYDRTFALTVTRNDGRESEFSNIVVIPATNKGKKPRR
jgi:hypothetical protein